jgi:predicted dienelactone hydrolase
MESRRQDFKAAFRILTPPGDQRFATIRVRVRDPLRKVRGFQALKMIRFLVGIVLVLLVLLGIALVVTKPAPLPAGTESSARLEGGPFDVDLAELVWVDETRPTDPNADYPGADSRTFEVALWSPIGAPGPHPLVVYSHGFMSTRHGGTHVAEHLASHGYVVVSTDYPLTHFGAPGGPNVNDVVHQPGDVSFLIDRTLALTPEERSFEGSIDPERIGVIGVSLGGLTSTLAAYHPRLGDPRIRAAVSVAGPTMMFSERFFESADVPFLMIGGTHDAMIPFSENAQPVPHKIDEGGLLAIDGGSHTGFSYFASGPLRLLGNPDTLGCWSVMQKIDVEPDASPFPELGGVEDGILDARDAGLPCQVQFEEAMAPGRQQWLMVLAAHAFFESRFAQDAATREAHAHYLATTFPEEIEDVEFTPADGGS